MLADVAIEDQDEREAFKEQVLAELVGRPN
jgi:hypothetical protein